MTDDRESFRVARVAGKSNAHEKRLESATYTAAEVRVLTETASKVALELGRREAQAECAAILEERASQRVMRGTEARLVLIAMADTIRSMTLQSSPETANGRTERGEVAG